jgi:UDP-N-acetylglucosamine--N-acetylmuramyl-(pentapeptide) pyrophosphoryl-undecaprenol N-acetylglucosamine transferase
LNPKLPTLLVTGGSQGAQALNDSIRDALPALLAASPQIQILHQVGDKNMEAYRSKLDPSLIDHDRYRMLPYIDDLAVAYSMSDVTLCRAGAMTIAELTAKHKPAIFVPYPYAAQDHQMHNGRYMESRGCAIVIPQNALNADKLVETVLGLLHDDVKLKNMQKAAETMSKPNAASDIATQLKKLGELSQG